MDGSKSSPVVSSKPAAVEREMHLVMTGRVASHTIGISGVTQNINVVEIGTSTIDKAISAAGRDIDNIGMVSMDSLFCPYVIGMNWEDHLSLPHWEEPAISGVVTATNLNPFNPAMAMTSAAVFYNTGPNLGIYNSIETLGEGDFCQFKNVNENELRLNSIKGVGLKAPIILTGWGYDTSDKPVPADSGNPDVFASGAFRDPSLWKSGPLDVRWDDDKKVWKASGGAGEFISFVVDNVSDGIGETSAGCNYVLATVTDIGHQTTAASIGDTGVKIFDEDFCYFNLPIPVLIGIKGKAIAYRNTYASSGVSPSGGSCITQDIIDRSYRWVVTGLCCGEEVFDA
jgi:hypothetical protein